MSEREKKDLLQRLKDTEIEIPSNFDESVDKDTLAKIHHDRVLHHKLQKTITYRAKSRKSEQEFRREMLSRLDHSEKIQKPSKDTLRNSVIYLREKLLYSETSSLRWSGAAAVFLIMFSMPLILSENTSIMVSYNEGPAGLSESLALRHEPEGVSKLSSGIVNPLPPVAPTAEQEAVPARAGRARERSFSIVIEKGDIMEDEADVSQEYEKKEITAKEQSADETALLKKLNAASTKEEKLIYLRKLEKFYETTNRSDKLTSVRKQIQDLN